MPGGFWDKVTDFIDEPVVQCDTSAVKYTSLIDGDNDDCEKKFDRNIWCTVSETNSV